MYVFVLLLVFDLLYTSPLCCYWSTVDCTIVKFISSQLTLSKSIYEKIRLQYFGLLLPKWNIYRASIGNMVIFCWLVSNVSLRFRKIFFLFFIEEPWLADCAQSPPDATPPIGKIHPFSKMGQRYSLSILLTTSIRLD